MKETKFKQTLVQTKEGSRHCEEHSDVPIQGGFKMTELGMIPSDWMVEPLANIANTASGGTPSRSNEAFYKGSIKWFTTTELKDCNLYDSVEHISKQAVECSSAKIFPKNTLLMAMYGATIGKLGLLKCDAATNQACCAIFPKKTDVLYLYYFLLHNRENIIAMGCGAGQPNVSQEIVKKINIPIPPTIKEQQRIANALSDVDTLIANLEKLIAKKKNIKQGAMQQLLTGKKRLPGFGLDERQKECHSERSAKREVEESSGYKMTELGMIPSDWEVKTVSDVADNFIGLTYSPENVRDYGTLVLRSSNIQNDKIVYEDNVFVDMVIPERALAHNGDILVCVRNGSKALIGKSAILDIGNTRMAFGAFMTVLRAKRGIDNRYLLYAWQSNMIQDQVQESLGATINQITNADFKRFYLLTPSSIEEQTAIANVLSDMDTEISALETKLAKYRKLKTGMMQQLLTGKIRLV